MTKEKKGEDSLNFLTEKKMLSYLVLLKTLSKNYWVKNTRFLVN